MRIRYTMLAVVLLGTVAADVYGQYPPPRSRGLGILGGLAGAGIGAAIGEDGGDAVPGALIGGAIGALGGAAVGGAIDTDEARRNYYLQAQQQQQRQLANVVTTNDVISMSQAGLSEDVIITHIRGRGMARALTANDCIVLKQQGVSDRVINYMQTIPQPSTTVVRPAPVVVHEYVYPRYYHAPYFHHYHHHPRHHRSHSSIHLRFGH